MRRQDRRRATSGALVVSLLIHEGRTTLVTATLWGTIANWLGNIVGYYLGARGIRFLPRRARESMGIEEVRGWLSRYGGWVVVFSRWFGLIRTPFILYAGAAGMPVVPYAVYSFIGALRRGKAPSSPAAGPGSTRAPETLRHDFGFRFCTRRNVWSPIVATW